jgi:trimethylamine--corrinoid protein Co-methyltransferase
MAKRFIQGIEVSVETLAREVIEGVGPGGHFLQEDHTFQRFREELWMPSLLTREHYDNWQATGSKDMAQRVRERVKEIADGHQALPLPDRTVAVLEKLKQQGEEELTKD